jgi:hypothetical protein
MNINLERVSGNPAAKAVAPCAEQGFDGELRCCYFLLRISANG